MTIKQLSFNDLFITPADIYDQMGYGGTTPDEQTQHETEAVVNEVRQWLQPRFCFFVTRDLPPFNMGSIIERQLRGSEAYALFICTAGAEYEAWQQQLKEEDDMVRVFIADALGSVIAEKCADRMEEHLQQNIDKLGWYHTNRFSPGYCGWHVSEQQLLFSAFATTPPFGHPSFPKEGNATTPPFGHPSFGKEGNQTCGVRLTDSSLMVPIKSVSGLIGLGKEVSRLDYSCGLCNMSKCYKRVKIVRKNPQASDKNPNRSDKNPKPADFSRTTET